MDNNCRGIACIINVYQVSQTTPRHGTHVDRDRLKQLFEQLCFRVEAYNDEDDLRAEVSYLIINSPTELPYFYFVRVYTPCFTKKTIHSSFHHIKRDLDSTAMLCSIDLDLLAKNTHCMC